MNRKTIVQIIVVGAVALFVGHGIAQAQQAAAAGQGSNTKIRKAYDALAQMLKNNHDFDCIQEFGILHKIVSHMHISYHLINRMLSFNLPYITQYLLDANVLNEFNTSFDFPEESKRIVITEAIAKMFA